MAEHTISGHVYQTRKLPLVQQFHISRKLTPYIIAASNLEMRMAIMAALARVSDADSEYIVDCALGVTQRKQETVWANVGTLRAPMFSDLLTLDVYDLTCDVVVESLADFFAALLSKIAAAKPLTA